MVDRIERRLAFSWWLVAAVGVAPPAAEATDITVSHAAVERLVWRVLLTEGGRDIALSAR